MANGSGTLSNNHSAIRRLLLASYLPPLVALALAWLLAELLGVPFSTLTRDPAAVAQLPFVTGWISYLGAVLMAAAASIALFVSAHVRPRRCLAGLGIFSLVLLADDLFMLHDGLLDFLGIAETLVVGTYGLLLLYILASNREYLRPIALPLAVALMFFALSAVTDLMPDPLFGAHRHIFEDGAKLLGMAGWLGCIVHISHLAMRRGEVSHPQVSRVDTHGRPG